MAFGSTVDTGGSAAGGSGNSVDASFTAATLGNLLLTCFAANTTNATVITPPSGFTMENSYIGVRVAAWAWKIAVGGETNVSWSWDGSGSDRSVVVQEYEGPFADPPVDVKNQNDANVSSATNSQDSSNITTTQASELLAAFFTGGNASAIDAGRAYSNSFVEDKARFSSPRPSSALATKLVSSTGTYNTVFTSIETPGTPMWSAIAGLKEDIGGGGGINVLRRRRENE